MRNRAFALLGHIEEEGQSSFEFYKLINSFSLDVIAKLLVSDTFDFQTSEDNVLHRELCRFSTTNPVLRTLAGMCHLIHRKSKDVNLPDYSC